VEPALQVGIRHGAAPAARVRENRNIFFFAIRRLVVGQRAALHAVAGHDVDSSPPRPERGFVFGGVAHFDDPDTHERMAGHTRCARPWNHHFVFGETGQIGNANVQVRVASVTQARLVWAIPAAQPRRSAPIGARNLRQAPRRASISSSSINVMLSGRFHCADFRQLERSADYGQGPTAIDQRPDPNDW